MTTLLDPVRLNARAGFWQYDLDDLSAAGVVLGAAQWEAASSWHPTVVLVAWALPDPTSWVNPVGVPPQKFEQAVGRATVPALAEIDWGATDELEEATGGAWRTFPSIPVRVRLPEYAGEHVPEVGLSFVRIWDVAAVDEHWWGGIDNALAWAWSSSEYSELRDLSWAMNGVGRVDECWLACRYLSPDLSTHHHVDSYRIPTQDYRLWRCIDGEGVLSDLHQKLLDDDNQVRPVNIPILFDDPGAEWSWKDLCEISKPAAEQVLLVAPPWEREQLRAAERKAGRPWG